MTKKMLAAFGLIMMLATSPMSVAYSQAEETHFTNDEVTSELAKSPKSAINPNKGIVSEEIIDGKLKMKYHQFNHDTSLDDLQKFMLEGKTNGWAYVNGKAYESGIVLYNGKVAQIDEKTWNVSTKGILDLDGKSLNLELEGKIHGSDVFLKGTASNDEFNYKVIFTGKIVKSNKSGIFGLSFMNAEIKDPETGQTIRILQVGQVEIKNLEDIKIIPELSRTLLPVA